MIFSNWTDSDKEKQEIIELTKKTFGDVDISNSSYFDWQYRKNPNGKAVILLARDNSKNNILVGINVIIPTKLLLENKEIFSSLACNVQVHPDYQKQGIFSKLLSSMPSLAKQQNISSFFAIPNRNSFSSFIKTGSLEIIQLPLLIRPIKFSKYFSSSFSKILKIFEIFWKPTHSSINIEKFDGNFQNFEILLKKLSKRVSIVQNRNEEFLRWRYLDHPTRNYQICILRQNNELVGYIIFKIHIINNKKIGVILDFIVDADVDEKYLKRLIKKALNYFWTNDASVAISTCRPGLLEYKLLSHEGFFNVPSFLKPEPLHFIVQLFDSEKKLHSLNKFENWFFTFGDYDVF